MVVDEPTSALSNNWAPQKHLGQIKSVSVTNIMTIVFPEEQQSPHKCRRAHAELHGEHISAIGGDTMWLVDDIEQRQLRHECKLRAEGPLLPFAGRPKCAKQSALRKRPDDPNQQKSCKRTHKQQPSDSEWAESDDEEIKEPKIDRIELDLQDDDLDTCEYDAITGASIVQAGCAISLFDPMEVEKADAAHVKAAERMVKLSARGGGQGVLTKSQAFRKVPKDLLFTEGDREVFNEGVRLYGEELGISKMTHAMQLQCTPIKLTMRQLQSMKEKRAEAALRKDAGLLSKSVPRGCGLGGRGSSKTVAVFCDKLRKKFPDGLHISAFVSSLTDDFATLTLRVPPHLPGAPRHQGAAVIDRVAAPFSHAAPLLRELLVECELGGLFEASRGTFQLFAGYTASKARAVALKAQAFGVYEGKNLIENDGGHPLLDVPTLVHKKYVTEGAIPLGEHLSCVPLAQHKHKGVYVKKGPWRGHYVSEAFTDAIELIGQHISEEVLLLLASACPDRAKAMLQYVAKSGRLGGDDSIATATSIALYGTGPMLVEWEDRLQKVITLEGTAHDPTASDVSEEVEPTGVRLTALLKEQLCEQRVATLKSLPGTVAKYFEAEILKERREISQAPASHFFSSVPSARDFYNEMSATQRIDKRQVHYTTSKSDLERGSAEWNPAAYRQVIDECTNFEWLPDEFDITEIHIVENVRMEANRFVAACLGTWLQRRRAGICRKYKTLGYEGVVQEMREVGRSEAAIAAFTPAVMEQCINLGYKEHLKATAKVLSPGTFLDESRFYMCWLFLAHNVGLKAGSVPSTAVASGSWGQLSEIDLLGRIVAMALAVTNMRPEAGQFFLNKHGVLLEEFCSPQSSAGQMQEKVINIVAAQRDLWTEAPVNGGLDRVQAATADAQTKSADRGCSCDARVRCHFGRHTRCGFRQVTIDRAQPMGSHCSFNKENTLVPSQASEAWTACHRLIFDKKQMAELLEAAKNGGESAIDKLLRHKRVTKKSASTGASEILHVSSVGIIHVQNVRAKMCSRLVFALWQRLRLQRGIEAKLGNEIPIPGDASVGPSLAPEPLKRVMAFCPSTFGADLEPAKQQSVARALLAYAASISGELSTAWIRHERNKHPDLNCVHNTMHCELRLGCRWDPQRWEEITCDVAKDWVGAAIACGIRPTSAALQGFYDPTLLAGAGDIWLCILHLVFTVNGPLTPNACHCIRCDADWV